MDAKTEARLLLGLDDMGDGCVEIPPCDCEPVVVSQVPCTPISVKNDQMLHMAYDAKLKDPVSLEQQFTDMDLDKWSKFVSRIQTKQVKVDTTITAMGIFAMFPVAMQDGE